MIAPTLKPNYYMAGARSAQGSELLGDGSKHFQTQIKIAQAMVTPTDYQTDVSTGQCDVNSIMNQ
jgi:hypothetical protein